MPQHNPPAACPRRLCGIHIQLPLLREDLPSYQSGIARPPGDCEGRHQAVERPAKDGGHSQGQDEARDREEYVRDSHERLVGLPTHVASEGSKQHPECDPEYHHREGYLEVKPVGEEDPAEDVEPELVRT